MSERLSAASSVWVARSPLRCLAFGVALIACGTRSVAPATPGAPSAEPSSPISELPLRLDHVRRLREMRAATPRGDARRHAADRALADALVALAQYHRRAAVEADPKAASLPPPRDLREPKEEPERTGYEAEIDYPVEAEPEPAELPRDDATFAGLTAPARAHVRAADRCVREAVDVLQQISWMAGDARPRDLRPLDARQAELLDEIGQRADARKKWAAVLHGEKTDALTAAGYLAFAEWFAAQKRKETATLFAKSAESAAIAKDAPLLRRVCDRARAASVEPPPACVSP